MRCGRADGPQGLQSGGSVWSPFFCADVQMCRCADVQMWTADMRDQSAGEEGSGAWRQEELSVWDELWMWLSSVAKRSWAKSQDAERSPQWELPSDYYCAMHSYGEIIAAGSEDDSEQGKQQSREPLSVGACKLVKKKTQMMDLGHGGTRFRRLQRSGKARKQAGRQASRRARPRDNGRAAVVGYPHLSTRPACCDYSGQRFRNGGSKSAEKRTPTRMQPPAD
ncbi:hypothetical protein CC78DRAFT_581164 [Lojkania enalia]|uniref:Uncharacterized protein n=1 Tax=Lojkania enalia TaxID=147567 RepID=A0A9P4MZJ1_9PLEO|nr:hypothetical protein CC78DRAFT_581164 [Didymosphaeria enalia]